MIQIDPGRPPGDLIPLENQVPNQEIDGPRAMLPLLPVREQEHHAVREHDGLGHEQHDERELENMLPLQQMVNLDQDDHMLEDGNARPREHVFKRYKITRLSSRIYLKHWSLFPLSMVQ